MNIQDDIKKLQEYESFARFIKMIHDLREETIEEMHEAPTDRLKQLSGRIITYDQIIQMSDWRLLQARFHDFM